MEELAALLQPQSPNSSKNSSTLVLAPVMLHESLPAKGERQNKLLPGQTLGNFEPHFDPLPIV